MKYFWNYYIPLRAGPVNQESHRYFIYRYLTDIFVKSYAYLTDISSSCIDLIFVFQFNFVVNIRVHSSYHHQIAFTEFELQNLNYKYTYSELFRSAFSRIRTEYGEIRIQDSVRMQENVDQNNSEYGHFLRSVWNGF